MLLETQDLIRFEGYVVNRSNWTLQWEQEPIALNPKSFDLLVYLIDHRDRVCSKDELLAALWPDLFIDESNLTQQIFLLRKALSRHKSEKKIIKTISGRGYQFTIPLEAKPGPALEEPVQQQIIVSSRETVTLITIEEEEIEAHGEMPPDLPQDDRRSAQSAVVPAHSLSTETVAERPRSGTNRSSVLLWIFACAMTVALLAGSLVRHWNDPADLRVTTYAQITTDGRSKSLGGIDGSRIYFTELRKKDIAEISVSGGVEAPVQLGIEEARSGDVSPDGSTLLVISQAGGQGPAASLWAFRLVEGSRHHLADAVLCATWSPDGEKVVYASANNDLVVIRRDGSEAHRIASFGSFVKTLAWSPDGKTVLFSRDGLLWEIAPDGTNLHQLLPGWGGAPTQWSGAWAQDGRLFFVADGQIWMLPRERAFGWNAPSSPVQLTFGPTVWDRPIPSADGKKIYASGRTPRGELVRFDTTSSQFKPFLSGISAEFVVFSKDSRSVAYVSYPERVLWRANPDGSNPVQLTEPPIHPKSIRWSPDGSQIAFVDRTAGGADAIFVLASDGSGRPQRILPQDRMAETDPSWSPDGRKIAFSTSPAVGASAQGDLRIFDFASSKATVMAGSEGLLVPHWSPDGRTISAMTVDTESMRLFDLPSARWTKLDTGAVAFPEWSHDSQWIYYVRWTDDPFLLRIRPADGRQEEVADLKGARYTGTYSLWMGLDPEDAPMMLRDEGTDDIYSLTLERQRRF